MVFTAKVNEKQFNKQMKLTEDQIADSAGIAMFKSAEQVRTVVVKETIGPKFWDRNTITRLLQLGGAGNKVASRNAGIAFGMATNIAKRDLGFGVSFSRGKKQETGQRLRTDKKTGAFRRGKKGQILKGRKIFSLVGRGAGWIRVLELLPFMAIRRPPGKQEVWAHKQDGLRKTLVAGGRTHKRSFGNKIFITISKRAIAIGVINSPKEYSEKLEKKYRWLFPVALRHVQSGKTRKNVQTQIVRDFKKRKKELGT